MRQLRTLIPVLNPTQGALIAILVLAAALRFQNLHAIQHNVDHAYPIWQALTTLDRGEWPIIGQNTSVLIPNPVLTGYLLIPWVALTRSPIGPYLFVITLNTIAVWLAYQASVMLLENDRRRALIASFLMAVNPWVIEYSRATWVQALIPFFACLVFWLLTPVLLGRAARPHRRMILALIALTAMTQTYLLAFAIAAPVVILFIIFRKRVPWRAVVVGVGIFVFATAIYGLAIAINKPWISERINQIADGQPRLSVDAWTHAVRLVSGQNFPVSRGMDAPISDWVLREYLSLAAHYVILAAIVVGIGRAALTPNPSSTGDGRIERGSQILPMPNDAGVITLIWFAVPTLMMTFVSGVIHPFYLLLTLPAGHVLAAQGAGILCRWRAGRVALVIGAAGIAILFGVNILRFAEDTLAHPGAHQLGALPVGAGIDMMHMLVPAESRSPGAVIFADVNEWTLNSLAGQLFTLDRSVNVDQITYVPTGGATYLLFSDGGSRPAQAIGVDNTNKKNGEWYVFDDGSFVQRYRVGPESLKGVPLQKRKGDKGIAFLTAVLEQPLQTGQQAVLLTYWQIDELRPDRWQWNFAPFVHIFDTTGKRVAIGGGVAVPGLQWRLGDIHIQRMTVAIPADAVGPFTVQVGQYDGVLNLNVLFTQADGSGVAAVTVQP
jgi:4-amino-4-deoxy-L-arabinose transferase-like glycosyltransferase